MLSLFGLHNELLGGCKNATSVSEPNKKKFKNNKDKSCPEEHKSKL